MSLTPMAVSGDQLALAGFAGLGIGMGMVLGVWAIRVVRRWVDQDETQRPQD